jgi:sugar phosphate permease
MFIYWLAYLDRANLGVAKLQMQPQLGFTDEVIGLGAGIFFRLCAGIRQPTRKASFLREVAFG